MPLPFQDIIFSVNDRLKAREVIHRIGFRTDSVVQIGTKLKCFCPIHRSETFKSLQIDEQSNTAQCIVKDCGAHGTLTMVELYAKAKDLAPLTAALELASSYDLALDPAAQGAIADYYLDFADKAAEAGKKDEEIEHLRVAQAAAPERHEIPFRLAQAEEASGNMHEALEAYLLASKVLEDEDPKAALELLREHALRLDTQAMPVLELYVRLLEKEEGPTEEWANSARILARRHLTTGNHTAALALAERILPILEEDPEVVLLYAELLQLQKRDDIAVEQLLRAASLFEKKMNTEKAKPLYERVIQLAPTREDLRVLAAEFFARIGDEGRYAEELNRLAWAAMERGDMEHADSLLQQVLLVDPDNLPALETMVEVASNSGDSHTEVERLFQLVDLASRQGSKATSIDALERIRGLDPQEVDHVYRLAKLLLDQGEHREAAELYLKAGSIYQALEEQKQALTAYRKALDLFPGDEGLHLRIIQELVSVDLKKFASEFYLRLAQHKANATGVDAALRVMADAINACGPQDGLLDAQLEFLLQKRDLGKLTEALKYRVEGHIRFNSLEQAEELLVKALDVFPGEANLLEQLADVYLIGNRTDEARAVLLEIAEAESAPLELRVRATEQAVELDIADYDSLLYLAQLHEKGNNPARAGSCYQQASEALLDAGERERALKALDEASRLAPDDPGILELSADIALAGSDETGAADRYSRFTERIANDKGATAAREAWERIIQKAGNIQSLRVRWAEWLLANNDMDGAAAQYSLLAGKAHADSRAEDASNFAARSVELGGDSWQIRILQATVLDEQGKQAEAQEEYRKAFRLAMIAQQHSIVLQAGKRLREWESITAEELFDLARTYRELGDDAGELDILLDFLKSEHDVDGMRFAALERVVLLDPKQYIHAGEYADLLFVRDRADEAAPIYTRMAAELIANKEFAKARILLEKARDIQPESRAHRTALLDVLDALKDKSAWNETVLALVALPASEDEDATDLLLLKELNERHPMNAVFMEKLADKHLALGQTDDAVELLSLAAAVHETGNDSDEGLRVLGRICELEPNNHSLREHRAGWLRRLERIDEARAEYYILLDSLVSDREEGLLEHVLEILEEMDINSWEHFRELPTRLLKHQLNAKARSVVERFLERNAAAANHGAVLAASEYLLEQAPEDSDYQELHARALAKLNRMEEAEEEFLALLDSESSHPEHVASIAKSGCESVPASQRLRVALLHALVAVGDVDSAAAECLTFIESDAYKPSNAECCELAAIVFEVGLTKGPFAFLYPNLLKEAGEKDKAVQALGKVADHFEVTVPTIARKALEEILDIHPDSADLLARLYRLVIETEGNEAARPLQARTLGLYASTTPDHEEFLEKATKLIAADPGNLELRVRFAEILQQRGRITEAVEQVVELDDEYEELKEMAPSIALLLKALEWEPENIELLNRLSIRYEANEDNTAAAQVHRNLFALHETMEERDAQIIHLMAVVRLDKSDSTSLVMLITLLKADSRTEEVVEYLRLLASVYRDAGLFREEAETLGELYQLNPLEHELLQQQATALIAAGDLTEALPVRLRHISKLRELGKSLAAIESAKLGIKAFPDSTQLLEQLLALYFDRNDHEGYATTVKALVTLYRQNSEAAAAITQLIEGAAILVEGKAFAEADALLATFIDVVLDVPDLLRLRALAFEGGGFEGEAAGAWMALAKLHGSSANIKDAEAALRRALVLRPKDPTPRRMLVDMLSQLEDRDTTELVQEITDLARLLENQDNEAEALPLYRELVRIDPQNLPAYIRFAELLDKHSLGEEVLNTWIKLGELAYEFDENTISAHAFQKARELDEMHPTVLRGLMKLEERQGREGEYLKLARILASAFDKAQALEDANLVYAEIATRDPRDEASRARLADYYQQTDEPERAARYLRELYRIYLDANSISKATEVLHLVERLDGDNPETLELLGRLYASLKDDVQATEYLLAAARRHSEMGEYGDTLILLGDVLTISHGNIDAIQLQAEVYEALGEETLAKESLLDLITLYREMEELEKEQDCCRRLLKFDPNNLAIRERNALLLADLEEFEQAVSEMLKLSELREEKKNFPAALEAISTAIALAPDDLRSRYRLAEFALQHGDTTRADTAFAWLADHFIAKGEYEQAIQELRKAPSVKTDAELLLRAARILQLDGKPREALEHCRRAVQQAEERQMLRRDAYILILELKPNDQEALRSLTQLVDEMADSQSLVEVWSRTLSALLQEGEVEDCRTLLEEGLQKLPDAILLRKVAASLFEQNGLPELAAREYIQLSILSRPNKNFSEALEYTERALKLKPGNIQAMEEHFWVQQALGKMDELWEEGLLLIDALGERSELEKAIVICQELIEMRPEEPEPHRRLSSIYAVANEKEKQAAELRLLAGLYTKREDHEEATDILRTLLSIRPDDTRARSSYIESYRNIGPELDLLPDYQTLAELHERRGAVMEATRLYERMIAIAPDNLLTREKFITFMRNSGQEVKAQEQLYELVTLLTASGEARRALDHLQAVRDKAVNDPRYHLLLGRAHLGANARGMAARELRTAANLMGTKGHYKEQSAVLNELLAIDPLNLEFRQQLIDAYIKANMKTEAVVAMEELAERYIERGLADLAEVEMRRAIELEHDRLSAWKLLFKAAEGVGDEVALINDYLEFAEMLARRGDLAGSLEYYTKVMELDPNNIRAYRGYVHQYPKTGQMRDIVDEILTLAQLLVESGEIDEGLRHFELVVSIDPQNTTAREMLSATQSRHELTPFESSSRQNPMQGVSGMFELPPNLDSSFDDQRLSETQKRFVRDRTVSASDYLAGTLDKLEQEDSKETLSQVVSNYQSILSVNAQNAAMRVKLADVLQQMGRIPEMLVELAMASETFFSKGELNQCVNICERYLSINPTDQRIRKRLSEAVVKRDAMKALESAILYSDNEDDSHGSRQ